MKYLPFFVIKLLGELFYHLRRDDLAQKFFEERNRRNKPWIG